MKIKHLISAIAIIVCSSWLNAQQDIYLKINHKLGSANFAYGNTTSNNQADQFTFTRLEYYISEITLVHDGGQQTTIPNKYILVKAKTTVNEMLGNFNISNLESIKFGIGVEQPANHSDISTYPAGHPLSFQTPSMHWGWAAGYRFAALEGNTGSAMNQTWQLHALGDKNYGHCTVTTSGLSNGTMLTINLDADYSHAMDDLTVDPNLNYHGENSEAPTALSNLKTKVFSASQGIGLEEIVNNNFSIAPNPNTGSFTLRLEEEELNQNSYFEIIDMQGRSILKTEAKSATRIDLTNKGVYLVKLQNSSTIINTQKLIIH